MILAEDLERIGLNKLLEFLCFESREDLRILMVRNNIPTLEDLAVYLSQEVTLCRYCHSDFIYIMYDLPVCSSCHDIMEELDPTDNPNEDDYLIEYEWEGVPF